jgi:hypothetical protein
VHIFDIRELQHARQRPPGGFRNFPVGDCVAHVVAAIVEATGQLGALGREAEAGRQNMSLPETMAMTGHHSVATAMGHFRAECALGSKVRRMLDEE